MGVLSILFFGYALVSLTVLLVRGMVFCVRITFGLFALLARLVFQAVCLMAGVAVALGALVVLGVHKITGHARGHGKRRGSLGASA